jgi:predicted DNA-binding transcriptional regulator AlpA
MDFGDVLLEPKEAAAFLKVSLSWLAKARAANDGPPFVRIGRCVRYSTAALLRWIKSREVTKTLHRNAPEYGRSIGVQRKKSRLGTYV